MFLLDFCARGCKTVCVNVLAAHTVCVCVERCVCLCACGLCFPARSRYVAAKPRSSRPLRTALAVIACRNPYLVLEMEGLGCRPLTANTHYSIVCVRHTDPFCEQTTHTFPKNRAGQACQDPCEGLQLIMCVFLTVKLQSHSIDESLNPTDRNLFHFKASHCLKHYLKAPHAHNFYLYIF